MCCPGKEPFPIIPSVYNFCTDLISVLTHSFCKRYADGEIVGFVVVGIQNHLTRIYITNFGCKFNLTPKSYFTDILYSTHLPGAIQFNFNGLGLM